MPGASTTDIPRQHLFFHNTIAEQCLFSSIFNRGYNILLSFGMIFTMCWVCELAGMLILRETITDEDVSLYCTCPCQGYKSHPWSFMSAKQTQSGLYKYHNPPDWLSIPPCKVRFDIMYNIGIELCMFIILSLQHCPLSAAAEPTYKVIFHFPNSTQTCREVSEWMSW